MYILSRMKKNIQHLLDFFLKNGAVSRQEISDKSDLVISPATLKRYLSELQNDGLIQSEGKGKATVYKTTPLLELTYPLDLNSYFILEQDERKIRNQFDLEIFSKLEGLPIFSRDEERKLKGIHDKFLLRINDFRQEEYQIEMERLAIDLSWKSSQIEGNTYSLLETELLLKEKKTAKGKTKDEATMLLNHKEAIDFIVANNDYASQLSVKIIEELHSILTKDLGINRKIRRRKVGITGTNYNPLDNEFQIREALENTCQLVNQRSGIYEKSFLTLVLISYIQPFLDGNKRTARILSNAILIAHGFCPLSFRTVDPLDYKKAMLVFYEKTNLHPMKGLFIDQAEFAVNTYF